MLRLESIFTGASERTGPAAKPHLKRCRLQTKRLDGRRYSFKIFKSDVQFLTLCLRPAQSYIAAVNRTPLTAKATGRL